MILRDKDGDVIFYSGVCIDFEIVFNGIMVLKVSEGYIGVFVVSVFGVFYLRKG